MKRFDYTLDAEQIPTRRIVKVTREGGKPPCVRYACPHHCWAEHYPAWVKERRRGNETAPEPMPYLHLMFDHPMQYGCIPYGSTDPAELRAAWESDVRAMLHGWDRDMTPEQVDRIVNATVDAKLKGVETGAFPFLACLLSDA